MLAVVTVRTLATAPDSLARIFERMKFGMAVPAMIMMTATTIKSSIRVKPADLVFFPLLTNLLEASIGDLAVSRSVYVQGFERGGGFAFSPAQICLANWGAGDTCTRTGGVHTDHAGLVGEVHVLSGGSRGDWRRRYGVGLVGVARGEDEGIAALS